MNSISTWIKKITFELSHPTNEDNKVVRTLVVSDTLHIPEGYPSMPSMEELGFISFDYRDPADAAKIHQLILKEVIRSKIDGLSPAAVSEVIRTVNESTLRILATSSDRVNSKWCQRFGVKLTLPGREKESLWHGGVEQPVYHFVGGEWSGIGDPDFYSTCIYVSKIVAAGKAEEIMRSWKRMGLLEQPIKVDVQEVCYGRQTIQLSTEFQQDELHGGRNAFASYRAAEMIDA